MPTFLNWLLRLIPTNPICMRLVTGGSVRTRHLFIRSGYLAIMIVMLLLVMLSSSTAVLTVRDLAASGAKLFTWISYLQLGLICLLTPVFMAGAIAQEANPKTWDILLTTPLNSLQIVLGNLFGRLFFVLALLFSTLPLFAITQYFGGVPGESIFSSYMIAAISSLLVAAIAVTLSVTRTAGRRAVFIFYVSVILYLFITWAIDLRLRVPVGVGVASVYTTWVTPFNPFLALEVLLSSNNYVSRSYVSGEANWLTRLLLGSPITAYVWIGLIISLLLIAFSTLRVRLIGAEGGRGWFRKLFGLGAKGALERPARAVGANPVAWREAVARGKSVGAIVGRWSFVIIGVAIGISVVAVYHFGLMTHDDLRLAVGAIVGAEIVIIVLTALIMSATAVSREREDGSLDIILTTPIQPGPYIAGKLRGIVQFIAPMMSVPVITLALLALYIMANGLGREGGVMVLAETVAGSADKIDVPVVLPETALAVPLMLAPFLAFCVMVGLGWSIKSKGTISSVVAAVAVVIAVSGVLGLCGLGAKNLPVVGAVLNTLSPINVLWAGINPAQAIPESILEGPPGRIALVVGAAIAGAAYIFLVVGLHTNMKRTFMMTVRKLAGTS